MAVDLAVSIGSWTAQMADRPFVDDLDCRWYLGDLDGWWDTPDVRSSPSERPGQDGDYDGATTFAGRNIIIGGHVTAPTRGKLMAGMERLSALLTGPDRMGTLTVLEGARGVARQCTVRLGDRTKIQPAGSSAPLRGVWSLSVYAPDPRRYGTVAAALTTTRFTQGVGRTYPLTYPMVYGALGSNGILHVANAGNVSTWPVITIQGPVTNPSVRLVGGPTLAMALTVASGQTLVIDTGARTVLLDGVSRRSFLAPGSTWFSIPPGSSDVYYSADSGTGALTVAWRDAWS